MSPKLRPLGGTPASRVAVHNPDYIPDYNKTGTNKNPYVSSEPHHTSLSNSKRDVEGLASEEKVTFVLEL